MYSRSDMSKMEVELCVRACKQRVRIRECLGVCCEGKRAPHRRLFGVQCRGEQNHGAIEMSRLAMGEGEQ